MFIRPTVAIISLILELYFPDLYSKLYYVITIVLNVSVSLAVYALMMLYHAFKEELKPHRPLAQFLCIKGVVFFAFWQGVLLELFAWMGWIHDGMLYKTEQIEYEVQYLLVCIEMGFLFTFAHNYAFNADFYKKRKD